MAHAHSYLHTRDIVQRMGNLRGYSAVMLTVGILILEWRLMFVPVEGATGTSWIPRTLASLLLSLSLVNTVSKWFARIPKPGRKKLGIDLSSSVEKIHALAAKLGIPSPRLVGTRSFSRGAFLRGWGQETAVVVGTETAKILKMLPEIRDGVIAHELGHAAARDQQLYFRLKAINFIALLIIGALIIGSVLNGDPASTFAELSIRVAVSALLAFLATRHYIRFREHVADVEGSALLGDSGPVGAGLVMMPDKSLFAKLTGLHPSPARRQAILDEPHLLVGQTKLTFFALGVSGGFFTSSLILFLQPFFEAFLGKYSRSEYYWTGLVGGAAVVAGLLSQTLIEHSTSRISLISTLPRISALLASAMLGVVLLSPLYQLRFTHFSWSHGIVALGTLAGASLLITASVGGTHDTVRRLGYIPSKYRVVVAVLSLVAIVASMWSALWTVGSM